MSDPEMMAARWQDLPRGHYATEIFKLDVDATLDECDEASYEIVGYRIYERKISRTTKTGRRIGKDLWRGRVVVVDDSDPARIDAYLHRPRWERDHERQLDIWGFLQAPEIAQATFGRFTGRCGCCGRTLTDPASKMRGIGPECAKGSQP